ncbi:MAG: hypothetical protein KJO28_14475 [Desulfofustis sp.]|nr:hypothetical protein [Desulfofustis sp.]
MEKLTNLLIVAGAGRNVGKTEFACRLIARISRQMEIYGLKVSAVHPDEAIYHGDHSTQLFTTNLYEESRSDLDKDTSRMLRAGAKKVYYLQGDDEQICTGFEEFQRRIPLSAPVVCESSSLWKYVRPGLLVIVKTATGETKPRSMEIAEHASLIVESDGLSGFSQLKSIAYSDVHGWLYGSGQPVHD